VEDMEHLMGILGTPIPAISKCEELEDEDDATRITGLDGVGKLASQERVSDEQDRVL
jgi:hypothetical protein